MLFSNEMYGYIYRTHFPNGKMYIGKKKSSVFLHEDYIGSGGFRFHCAVLHYGRENLTVELLEKIFTNESDLCEREKYWIDKFDAVNSELYYNEKPGGNGGSVKGRKLSDLTKQRISSTLKGKYVGERSSQYGRRYTRSNHTKELLRQSQIGIKNSFYGRHHSAETREIISNKLKGNNNPMYGKTHTADARKRISESHKNKICINNGFISMMISVEELDNYINDGWNRGRLPNKKRKMKG